MRVIAMSRWTSEQIGVKHVEADKRLAEGRVLEDSQYSESTVGAQ